MVALQEGYKYSLLSLPKLNAVTREGALTLAEEGYALSTSHPVTDLQSLRSSLSRRQLAGLATGSQFLVVYARSHHPAIRNHENQVLERRLHRFHLGLLLACPFIAHEESVFLEGASRNGRTDARGQRTYERVVRMSGGPAPLLDAFHLRYALALGRGTRHLRRHRAGKRFGRVLSAFRTGLHASALDVRIHQFVRCVEAFVGSWRKEEFAAGASLLVSNIPESDLLQMYQIRSSVEHFGGWKAAIPVRGEAAKERVLIERAVQTQAMAHSVLSRFVANRALWPHYVDETTVKRFNREVTASDRATLWHAPLDVGSITSRINFESLRRAADRGE